MNGMGLPAMGRRLTMITNRFNEGSLFCAVRHHLLH